MTGDCSVVLSLLVMLERDAGSMLGTRILSIRIGSCSCRERVEGERECARAGRGWVGRRRDKERLRDSLQACSVFCRVRFERGN